MRALRQIFAIARTEFRFGLRRGAPVVVTAVIGLIVGAGILLIPFLNLNGWPPADKNLNPQTLEMLAGQGITVEEYTNLSRNLLADMTVDSTPNGWILIFLVLLLLPVAAAMVIPADRNFGMLELLRSSPITGSIYLMGKLLGVLWTVFLIALIPFSLFFGIYEIMSLVSIRAGIPAFLVDFYVKLVLMDAIPMFVWGTVTGVLSGISLHSRRGAILSGFGVGILSLLFWILVFRSPHSQFNIIDIAEYYIFQNYHPIAQGTMAKLFGNANLPSFSMLGEGVPVIGIEQVLVMYLIILVVLAVAAILARLWLRWKENF